MYVATYNLRMGGRAGERVHWSRIWELTQPSIFLVQESLSPEIYLAPHVAQKHRERLFWAAIPANRWGSALFVDGSQLRPLTVQGYEGWVVGAEIDDFQHPDGSIAPLQVFSLHAPAGPGGYVGQVERILDALASLRNGSALLLGGDFNITVSSPLPEDPFRLSRSMQRVLRRLEEEFGLINCWRTANPGQPLAQTLRWSRNPALPYHCDGLFVPRQWASSLRSCEVLSSPEWSHLSDHNPVVARFG